MSRNHRWYTSLEWGTEPAFEAAFFGAFALAFAGVVGVLVDIV